MSHFLILGWVPGYLEIIIIGIVVLLLFGHRLPSVMRSLGLGIVEFKKGISGSDDEEAIESEERKSGEKS